jgi:beta-glucanase (GH16 family)
MQKPLLMFLLPLVLLSSCNSQDTKEPEIIPPDGYELVWNDEFNYEGLPNPAKWDYDTGNHGWGNNELQNYLARIPETAKVKDGKLIITALLLQRGTSIEYPSARLVTRQKGDWLYGRIEVRAKLPRGRGTWPAIWMLPTDWTYGNWPKSGEIDIMEHVGYDMGEIHATVHTEKFNHSIGTQVGNSIMAVNAADEFHTYGITWTSEKIDFDIEGRVYFTFTNSGKGSGEWPFDKRFHLLLNIAIGGNWGGLQGVDNSIFPQTMEVEFVRVFQKKQ